MRIPRVLRVGHHLFKKHVRWLTSVTMRMDMFVTMLAPMMVLTGAWLGCKTPGYNKCEVWFMDHTLEGQMAPEAMVFLALVTMGFLGVELIWAYSGYKRDAMRKFTYSCMKLVNGLCLILVSCALALAVVKSFFSYFIVWTWALVALFATVWFLMVFLLRLPLEATSRRLRDVYVGVGMGLTLLAGMVFSIPYVMGLVHIQV